MPPKKKQKTEVWKPLPAKQKHRAGGKIETSFWRSGFDGPNGIPFTFEHDGKKYKVDGDADDIEQEGACIGVHFDGAIYKNGVKYGTVVLNWEVDTFEHDGTYCRITLVDEDNVEELSGLEETCLEEFPDFYEFPDNMAYRE